MSEPVREHGHGRRDAERNRAAVIAAAITTLAEEPGASMDAIAAAAGVGRATLYRHFPGREDLLGGILNTVIGEAHAIADDVLADDVAPREALGALARELAVLGERYRFMVAHRAEVAAIEAHLDRRAPDSLESYLSAAQRAGTVPATVPPAMAGHLLRGLLTAVTDAVVDGTLASEDAPAFAEGRFLALLGL